jgi:hypothetical protein
MPRKNRNGGPREYAPGDTHLQYLSTPPRPATVRVAPARHPCASCGRAMPPSWPHPEHAPCHRARIQSEEKTP